MSFKREGDDLSVLNMLKHQRVSELLGSHIPEDEARLLSNGRLTCTVCHHRPIFDTVAMLGKHRKGKKHILELSRYLKRKEELELESLKKIQIESVKCEMSVQAIISPRLLGCGGREHMSPDNSRRKTLELPTFSQDVPMFSISSDSTSPRSCASHVRRYLKTLHRKRSLGSLIEQQRENFSRISDCAKAINVSASDIPIAEKLQPLKENVKDTSQLTYVSKEFSLNLSGWIKDKDGKWVKDPNAEFDSDEEGPPLEN